MSAAVLTLEHPVDPVWGGVLYPAGRCSTWNNRQTYENPLLYDTTFVRAIDKVRWPAAIFCRARSALTACCARLA